MTLPNEILDSLLSGYLDDALSTDERARVEQLLQSDADVRHELESMRGLREMLRTIDRTDRPRVSQLLRNGFSERVVDAAIECARNEGVAEDHPLLRTTEAPSYRRPHSKRGKRFAAVILALAASGLIGAILLAPDWTGADSNQLAQQQGVTSGGNVTEDANSRIADNSEPLGTFAPNAIDRDQRALANLHREAAADAAIAIGENATNAIAVKESTNINSQPKRDGISEAMSSVAKVENAHGGSDFAVPDITVPQAQKVLLSVMVIDVRRTEAGRFSNPIRSAMKTASIASDSQRPVNEAIVNSVTQSVRSLDESQSPEAKLLSDEITGSVVYIEAPAKRIEQFINALMADRNEIESVGFSLAMEAPLSNVVRSLKSIHATEIRQAQAFEFAGEFQGISQTLARHLGDQKFSPWTDDATGLVDAVSKDDGPDIMARIFVLVR